ncbi:S41 family peptidase [Ideonella sp. DXS29W]|uniref:S41 family peptidase n=1 Tax=Ideonella lacteola TaxID=2984193 RepID=A0ABU9BUX7_9BURK
MAAACRFLALTTLVFATANTQAQPYDASAWQRDYAQLKQTLERDYANLAWFASPEGGVNLPRLDRLTRQSLRAARNDGEARQAIESFVRAFKDGHLSVLPDLAPSHQAATAVTAKPFEADDAAGACATLGFLPTARMAFSLPLESLPGFHLMGDGLATVYRTGLATRTDGPTIGVIRIQNFTNRAFPASCTQGYAALKAQGAPITEKALRNAADDRWSSALAEQLSALKAAGMTALLVDVGNNNGGDDSGDRFARLLTDLPVRSARLRMVASPAAVAYADQQLQSLDAGLKSNPTIEAANALTHARDFFVTAKSRASMPCDMAWVWSRQQPWGGTGCTRLVDVGYAGGYEPSLPRGAFGDQNIAYRLSLPSSADDLWAMWTGPLYVMTDRRTFSSAEMFAAVVQDNHLGKTVGTLTGGAGCGFMNGEQVQVLTHSRMRVRMPDCMRWRADGRNETAGIAPDLPVAPTEGEDSRQLAQRLLDAVAADQRPAAATN